MLNAFKIYESSHTDVGLYLVAWTLYTAIMFVASLRIHTAMAFTLGTLLLGFILLDLGHFGNPVFNLIAGYELIVCAFAAWYMMAGIIINDLAGKTVLKMGNPLIR
jgi:succinate-acetate transporter protein